MKRLSLFFASVVAAFWATSCPAADQTEERKQLEAAVAEYVSAFNQRDAHKLASLWTVDAIYVDPDTDEQVSGRAAIETHFKELFAESGQGRLETQTVSVQFVSPHVAIEQGIAAVSSPEGVPDRSEYSAVYVKADGAWLLDRITEEAVVIAPSNHEHLKELEWMVGHWADESDADRTEMTCQWSKNRNFLIRSFSVVSGDQINFSGMQVIGWDPLRSQVRSWVFDSDGGYADGFWTRKVKSWHIQTSGVLPDGAIATGVSLLTSVDDNSFTFQTIERQVDGELLPNVPESLLIRQGDTK